MTPVFARHRLPVVAGLATFLVLISSGSAWSYWTAQTSAAGSVSTDTIAVSQAGFASPDVTKYLPSSLTSTRSFTVTNNSTIAGAATVTIATSETGAADLPLTVWQYTSGTCTESTAVPSGATTGTWGSTTMPLALGADSQTKVARLCVRTSISDWKAITAASGGQTVNPVLSVSLNADGWVATAPTATTKQITAGMYPLTANFFDPASSPWFTIHDKATGSLCLDVAAAGGSGSRVISWTCHQETNQQWQFVPVQGNDQSFVTIRPRHAPGTRLTYTSAGVQQVAANASNASQRWYVQNSGELYQLVSAVTGKCVGMRAVSTDADMSVVDCDDTRAQLTFRQKQTLTMSTNSTDVILNFSPPVASATTLQKKTERGWVDVASVPANAQSAAFRQTEVPQKSSAEFRIIKAGSADIVYGGIVLARDGSRVTALEGVDPS